MGVYIFTLFLVLFLWIVLNKVGIGVAAGEKGKIGRRKLYIIFIWVWLFLVAALRNYTVGADTYTYLKRYILFAASKWSNIFHLAKILMFENGYVISNKILGYVSNAPRFFLAITSFIIVSTFVSFVNKKSKMPWLSFFIFITLGMFGESMCLIRQYIAIAFTLVSYDAIRNNRLGEFIIIVLLAASIHTSALIILPMFWLSKVKFSKKHFYLVFIFSLCFFIAIMSPNFRISEGLINVLAQHTTYARYLAELNYGKRNGAVGLTIIYFLFFMLIIFKLYRSNTDSKNMYIAFAGVSSMLTMLSFVTGVAERLLPYFSVMFIISVPEAIMKVVKNRIRFQYISFLCALLMFYYIGIVCRADPFQLIPYELWDKSIKWF